MSEERLKLDRRIHNQRVRLRQLEEYTNWQREARIWSKSQWFANSLRLSKENRELKFAFFLLLLAQTSSEERASATPASTTVA